MGTPCRVRGAGPTLIFLHGLGCDPSIWRGLHRLWPQYRTVLYDLLGHGAHQGPAATRLEDYQAQLASVVHEVGGAEVVLIGHSLGGVVAAMAAAEQRIRVRALVLCGTPFARTPQEIESARGRIAQIRMQGLSAASERMVQRWFPDGWLRGKDGIAEQLADMICANDMEKFLAAYELALGGDAALAACVSRISCPTLIVVGARDRSVKPSSAQALARAIEGAQLITARGVAHMLPVQAPQLFISEVQKFLSRV